MRRARGFTALELSISVAIVAILAALAWSNLGAQRRRSDLASATAELAALLRNARQNALTTGYPTVVMFFPQYANAAGGTGRVQVYVDQAHTFFSSSASPHFGGFDPAHPVLVGDSLLGLLDLPAGITVGLGGAAAPTLTAPYSAITASACSFCAASGDGRGAVSFDSRGRASFYSADGAPLSVQGGTVALQSASEITGYRMLLLTPSTGSVRQLDKG